MTSEWRKTRTDLQSTSCSIIVFESFYGYVINGEFTPCLLCLKAVDEHLPVVRCCEDNNEMIGLANQPVYCDGIWWFLGTFDRWKLVVKLIHVIMELEVTKCTPKPTATAPKKDLGDAKRKPDDSSSLPWSSMIFLVAVNLLLLSGTAMFNDTPQDHKPEFLLIRIGLVVKLPTRA